MDNRNVLILGVTASGKSRLAFELAKRLGGEILSIDSMKVYRRMDVGTAKPPPELRREVNYHLVDIVEPSESFSVGRFLELADAAIAEINGRGRPVIVAGGTAMYIKALLYGIFDGPGCDEVVRQKLKDRVAEVGSGTMHDELSKVDPEAAERIHPNDERRIVRALEVFEMTGKPISSFQRQFDSPKPVRDFMVIGLRRDKADASRRMNARVKRMVEAGLVGEVRGLLAEGKSLSKQARSAIGYAEIIEHLAGKYDLDEAIELTKKNTRKFAKAQRTWFKTFKEVTWLDVEVDETVESLLDRAMAVLGQ